MAASILHKLFPKHRSNQMDALKYLLRHGTRLASSAMTTLPHENPVQSQGFKEIRVPVPWGHIAAKEYGPFDGVPMMAVHGWQDNAGSFDAIAPFFPLNVRLVCVDLSGHGLSSHRPPGTFYGPNEYVSDIYRVANHLRWDKFNFVGHSLGSFYTLYFSYLFPGRVEGVIAFDGFCPAKLPMPFLSQNIVEALVKEKDMESWRIQDAPSYEPHEALQQLVNISGGYLSEDAARALLIRGVFPGGKGNRLVFSRDPRVRYSLAIANNYDFEIFETAAKNYNSKLLLFFGKDEMYEFTRDPEGRYRKLYSKNCSHYRLVSVEGNHYAHLISPRQYASHIAEFVSC